MTETPPDTVVYTWLWRTGGPHTLILCCLVSSLDDVQKDSLNLRMSYRK